EPEEDFEVNDGMINVEYGLTRDWALDLTLGLTSAATRFFDPNNDAHTDWGLMDTQIGLRYRMVEQRAYSSPWMPTLTARVGAIITGNYQADKPFAPGTGGTGGELGLYANKAFGDSGINLYGDVAWRFRNRDVPVKLQTRLGLYYDIQCNLWFLRD